MLLADYLIRKPTGAPLVMLIVALVLFALAALLAFFGFAYTANRPYPRLWEAATAAGLFFFVLAFITS